MDDLIRFFDVLDVLARLFTRAGRRELMGCALILVGAALTMLTAFYLVYGRGPDCHVVEPEKHRFHRTQEARLLELSESGKKIVHSRCQ
jgi:hypothetical protein